MNTSDISVERFLVELLKERFGCYFNPLCGGTTMDLVGNAKKAVVHLKNIFFDKNSAVSNSSEIVTDWMAIIFALSRDIQPSVFDSSVDELRNLWTQNL